MIEQLKTKLNEIEKDITENKAIRLVIDDKDYVFRLSDLKIGIDKTLKFKINSESETIVPCVYVKTDDDRIFTDEAIIEGQKVLELTPKKV